MHVTASKQQLDAAHVCVCTCALRCDDRRALAPFNECDIFTYACARVQALPALKCAQTHTRDLEFACVPVDDHNHTMRRVLKPLRRIAWKSQIVTAHTQAHTNTQHTQHPFPRPLRDADADSVWMLRMRFSSAPAAAPPHAFPLPSGAADASTLLQHRYTVGPSPPPPAGRTAQQHNCTFVEQPPCAASVRNRANGSRFAVQ